MRVSVSVRMKVRVSRATYPIIKAGCTVAHSSSWMMQNSRVNLSWSTYTTHKI